MAQKQQQQQPLKPGDKVQLVVGGPIAVVVHVNVVPADPDSPNFGLTPGDVTVAWVSRGVEHRVTYPPAALKLVKGKAAA